MQVAYSAVGFCLECQKEVGRFGTSEKDAAINLLLAHPHVFVGKLITVSVPIPQHMRVPAWSE